MDLNVATWTGLKLVAVVILVLINGFFVAAEFALVKVRDTQLEPFVAKGQRRARIARKTLHNLDACLSATQLGITMASLGLGWIAEPVFASLLEPVMGLLQVESPQMKHSAAFAVGFTTITFMHIVAGELAPKSLAIRRSLQTSLVVALPLHWFYRVSYPMIWLLNHTANWLLKRIGIEPVTEMEMVHSEEELRLIVGAVHKHKGTPDIGHDIVLNALDLRHRRVQEAMRPRQEIEVMDTGATIAECLDLAEKTRYSRFPLCEGGDLDRTLGVVHIKDLFAMRIRAHNGADLLPLAKKLIYVPETAHLEKLLKLFLDRKLHMAIVVDEYGSTTGMVTLENILEALVGQIQDEFDQEKPLAARTGESTWDVSGSLPLHDLEQIIGESLHEEGVNTVSGWVTHKLGGFAKLGDVLSTGKCDVRVEEMDGVLVARLKVTRKPEPPPVEDAEI